MNSEGEALMTRHKADEECPCCNHASGRIEALAAEVERLRVEVGEWKLLTESAEFKLGEYRTALNRERARVKELERKFKDVGVDP